MISQPHPAEELHTIGAVITVLRVEFPDVSVSKLRFLEAEGLIAPLRTPGGYRKYRDTDIARIQHVLRMQRDHFLPLRVIRDQLSALDRGLQLSVSEAPKISVPLPHPGDLPNVQLTAEELCSTTGISAGFLTELQKFGLVGEQLYHGADLVVVQTAKELAEFGLEPRHLKAIKVAAERAVDLAQETARSQRAGADTVRELLVRLTALHVALLRRLGDV